MPTELCEDLPRILPLHAELRHKRNRVVHLQFAGEALHSVGHLLRAAFRKQETQRPGYHDALCWYRRLFLMWCVRRLPVRRPARAAAPGQGAAVRRVEDLRRYLDEAFPRELRLDRLAERCRMSKTYLCRTFKAHTGMTVFGYVLQRRIEKAMLLLAATDEKIIAIASASGFHDLSHFNRTFRRIVGGTPSAYRARQQDRESGSAL